MKKFLKQLLVFSFPVLLLAMLSEFLLRNIPNDYAIKKEYLDKYSDSVEVLFLGSSHAFYGVNPAYLSSNSFNASHISQTLDYDFGILKKYQDRWSKLKWIALPISYFSLFSKLETSGEPWRLKNYTIYYGISSDKLIHHSEALSHKLSLNLKRIISYYVHGISGISCSKLGWGFNYNSKDKCDLNKTGKIAAQRHLKDHKYFEENVNTLKSIIEFARNKGVNVLLYTPPAYHTYTDNLDSVQLNPTINTAINFTRQYDNVTYRNFLSDSSFLAIDFFDADHLDEIGAKKLTCKFEMLMNQIKELPGSNLGYVK